MSEMVIAPETFVIPNNDKYILYTPLKGLIVSVNQAAINWLVRFEQIKHEKNIETNTVYRDFVDIGIIELANTTTLPSPQINKEFRPTDLVILASTKCPFRCLYCYASAGTYSIQFNLDAAKAAIRLAVNNAIDLGKDRCHLAFHGGGEPTTVFSFLQECVNYAKNIGQGKVEILPGITTNGYVNDQQLKWLGENMYEVQVSLDGPAWIQNEQRPLATGGDTFDRVFQTTKYLEGRIPELIIKATITNRHTSDMPAMAQFFCENFNLPRFHFGPVMEAGYSLQTGYGEPDPMTYVDYALQAQEVAENYGRQIVISLAQKTFPNVRYAFCGLTDPNFAITVEGNASACYEVLYEGDKRASLFHYGKYIAEEDRFDFDYELIYQLRQRTVDNLDWCRKCFAKWTCGGECQIRHYDSTTGAEAFPERDFRCIVNRELIRRKLIQTLQNKDVVQLNTCVDRTFGIE